MALRQANSCLAWTRNWRRLQPGRTFLCIMSRVFFTWVNAAVLSRIVQTIPHTACPCWQACSSYGEEDGCRRGRRGDVDEMRLWEAGCFYDLDLRSVQLQSSLSWKVSLILLTSSCLGSPFPILTHCLMRKNRPAATCECKNSGQNVTCNDNS